MKTVSRTRTGIARLKLSIVAVAAIAAAAGGVLYISSLQTPTTSDTSQQPLVGSWAACSSTIFYDAGGSGSAPPLGTLLTMNGDGTWNYGSSHGTWMSVDVQNADWTKWGISPYGNVTQRIVMSGWNGATADGPIEPSATPGTIDFVWVVYHESPPAVPDAGTIWLKFGHADLCS